MSANVFIVSPFLKTILLSRVNKVYLVLFLHVVPRYRQRIWGSWRYHPLESINVCFWQARCPTANHLNSSMEWIDWSWGPTGKAKSFVFIPHLSATHVPQHLSLSAKVLCTIFSFSSPATLKEDTLGGSIVIFFSYSGGIVLPLWHQWFPMVPGNTLFWWSAVLKKIECSASAIICLSYHAVLQIVSYSGDFHFCFLVPPLPQSPRNWIWESNISLRNACLKLLLCNKANVSHSSMMGITTTLSLPCVKIFTFFIFCVAL